MSLHLKFKLNDHCAQYPFILSAGRQRGKVDIYDSFFFWTSTTREKSIKGLSFWNVKSTRQLHEELKLRPSGKPGPKSLKVCASLPCTVGILLSSVAAGAGACYVFRALFAVSWCLVLEFSLVCKYFRPSSLTSPAWKYHGKRKLVFGERQQYWRDPLSPSVTAEALGLLSLARNLRIPLSETFETCACLEEVMASVACWELDFYCGSLFGNLRWATWSKSYLTGNS